MMVETEAVIEHISLGKTYDHVKKVYSISILYFDIGKGKDYLYHGKTNFIGVNMGDELVVSLKDKESIVPANPSYIFPEYFLIRVNEFNKVAVTPLEEWIEYLKTGEIISNTKTPGLEEAREKLRYYNMSKEEKYAYDEHINAVMIQNNVISTAKIEGFAEGIEQGIEKGKIQITQQFKAYKIPIDIIVKSTGLTQEEMEKL